MCDVLVSTRSFTVHMLIAVMDNECGGDVGRAGGRCMCDILVSTR